MNLIAAKGALVIQDGIDVVKRSRKNNFTFLDVETYLEQNAKTVEIASISSFCKAARWNGSMHKK